MPKSVDVEVLQKYMKTAPKFQEAMQILAKRKRGRGDTSFMRIKRMLNEGGMEGWTFEELKKFFSVLEEAGAGRVVGGATIDRARFVWTFHLQSVACAALGLPIPPRTKRDGTPIVDEDEAEGEFRPAPTPKRVLPKITEPTPPVAIRTPRTTPAYAAPAAPIQGTVEGGNVLVFNRGGMELEIDLTMVPKDAIRIRRLA